MNKSNDMIIQAYVIKRKSADSASLVIQYIHRIINNNKTPNYWTPQERKNPVIFDKQVQTYITMTLAVVKNKESSKMLSGGNFDFKDDAGSGYSLEVKYRENDEAVKEVVRCIREQCNFSCIPGKLSTSCFLPDREAAASKKEVILKAVCDKIEQGLKKLKAANTI